MAGLLLIAGVIPSFLGETHYAFLGYAKNFRQTPAKRQMDYLRQVGGSNEAAKELKLFNLSGYLHRRFTKLAQAIYAENVELSRRKLLWGGLLSMIGTLGYYGAYVYVIWRAVHGAYQDIHTYAFIDRRDHPGELQPATGVLDRLRGRGPGPFPHGSAGVLRDETHGGLEARSDPGSSPRRTGL